MASQSVNADALSQANAAFAARFYQRLCEKNENRNLLFSPFSISVAFAMVHLGAVGKTAEEIAVALSVDKVQAVHESFKELRNSLSQKLSNAELLIANRLFGNKDYILVQSYIDKAVQFYEADLQSLDFNSANSVKVINDWVANKTNEKIQNLLSDIDPMTALILINAVYFKGEWMEKFDKTETRKSTFFLNDGSETQVDFMNIESDFYYTVDEEADSQIIEIPYSGENLSMFIFLPNEKTGLKKLETSLSSRLFSVFDLDSYSTTVTLSLPKFKFELSSELKEIFESLGMSRVFKRGAELTGIGENLFVSKAVHKAFVEVNEEGTEAAAATAVTVVNYCMPLDPLPVKVDHPFLFAIVEKSSKSILFMGRVMKPEY